MIDLRVTPSSAHDVADASMRCDLATLDMAGIGDQYSVNSIYPSLPVDFS